MGDFHDTKIVETLNPSCDGGGGALGHPRVYVPMNSENGETKGVCGYCDTRFVLAEHASKKH